MRIINALQEYSINSNEIFCFLAGGMGHTEWQTECLNELSKHNLKKLVILNPFNSNMQDIEKQIDWEFRYLNSNNPNFIFSVYFDKYTDQPISMYELGRASIACQNIIVDGIIIQNGFHTIVSIHPNANKKQELLCQCKLAKIQCAVRMPKEHAQEIMLKYNLLKNNLKEENLCQ